MHIDISDYRTESDVEQKFLFPFASQLLRYNPEEIRTKDYLAPTEIDKGAGKKLGYYPDYTVYLLGLPVLVIEAKDPTTSVDKGLREAALYALEINKQFPPNVNPVAYVASCNGSELAFTKWDSENEVARVNVADLQAGSAALQEIISKIGRMALVEHAKQLRGKLNLSKWTRALRNVGGTSRQNESIHSNSFAVELTPILQKYFDPSDNLTSDDILRRCYVTSNEVTGYEHVLKSLLKERIPNQADVKAIDTTKKHAEQFDNALKKAISERSDVSDPLLLLVGGVGAGKSMFLERYFRYLLPVELKGSLIRLKVNFNKATDGLETVEKWICEQVCEEFANAFPDFYDNENLKRYFATSLQNLEKGALRELVAFPERQAEIRAQKLMEWQSDFQNLALSAIRYHNQTRNIPVVVTFDNVDRRDRDQQLRVFQTVQWFRGQAKCMCVLALRDETFDAFRNQPPLDAFLKPFAFRITAPRFISVVQRRLQLAIEYLNTKTDSRLTYELRNGMRVDYPATNLGRYLMSLYVSVFDQSRKIGLILEAISGKDTRRGLEMFTEILRSGYFPEDLIFSITEGKKRTVPEWLIIRILMRTGYRFYSSKRGYISNLLDFDERGGSGTSFLSAEILEYLAQRRKHVFAFSIEGYLQVEAISQDLAKVGYDRADVLSCASLLLSRGLIHADHQRQKGLAFEDYVKIGASGYYHLRFLSTRWEYLSNVAIDTPLLGSEAASEISRYQEDTRAHASRRVNVMLDNLREQARHLETTTARESVQSQGILSVMKHFDKAVQFNTLGRADGEPQLDLDI